MTRTRPGTRFAALVLAAVLLFAACGGKGDKKADNGGGGGGGDGMASDCPLDALDEATAPVEIVFWHSMARANAETLQQLVDQFNGSQSKVVVKLVNQVTYPDTFAKYKAGLDTGDLPDLVQLEETTLQQVIDTGSVLPAQACVEADDYDLSGHLQRVVDYYTVGGTLYPMPFNVSNPVFYYNKAAFTKAGLDPDKPPTTLEEVKDYAEKLKAAGFDYGFGLKTDPWYLEQWSAKAGETYVNNDNGRKERATAVTWDNDAAKEIFTWLSEMVSEGLAITNNDQGATQDTFNNLIGIGTGSHAMSIDTSASLGTITQVLGSGQFPNVELGVAPMPGPKGKGGVLVGGAALYITNKTSPEKQAAAWEFAKFLNEAKSQAIWAAGTGYIPIVEAAVDQPEIQEQWAEVPGYKIAYDQLLSGVNNTATAGPVIGPYQAVRDIVREAEQQMFTQGKDPDEALTDAADRADAAIEDYSSRMGL